MGVRKDTLHFLRAGSRYSRKTNNGADRDRNDGDNSGEASGRDNEQAGGMIVISSDGDTPSSLREPGHYDNIGNPMLDPDLRQHSQLGDSYRLPSFENSTTDYSGHSITHSISANYQIPPFHSLQGTSTGRLSYNGPQDFAKQEILPQGSAVQAPAMNIKDDDNDLNLRERLVRQRPATPCCWTPFRDGNFVASPEGYPGMICDRNRFKQEQVEDLEAEPNMYKNMDDNNKEDGHQHKHAGLCADEIAQGITSKQTHNIPTTTTVETRSLELHTRIQPREREEVTNVITRESHTTHIHPTIQPVINSTHLPQKHYLEREPGSGRLVEITPEQAARSGWDEVWRGSWVVSRDDDAGFVGGVAETDSVRPDRREIQGASRVSVH
ncbi:hypothetical protein Q9L58_005792 [Maublancomyces gigas]|uniref:Uncharacterized protein n=1 Tax=Discina gigas TaxID=1032678 RepID=A0ABR3GH84_9PEZI